MYVLDIVGTIFIKEMYGNKKRILGKERFQCSGRDASQLFKSLFVRVCVEQI